MPIEALLTWPSPKEAVAEAAAIAPEPYASLAARNPGDMGVLVAMLMNEVRLAPGQALYVPPRVPHAYLSGTGVELMAGSDNVLRAGLTPKHVDVPELLAVAAFEADPAVRRRARAPRRRGRLRDARAGVPAVTARRRARARPAGGRARPAPVHGGPRTAAPGRARDRARPGRGGLRRSRRAARSS